MSLSVKFTSRQVEMTEDGIVTTVSWTGGQEEIDKFSQEVKPGNHEDSGVLTSCRVYQESPNIWVCERKYLKDSSGESLERPHTVYGKKSAQLHGSMLSMPLESHKNYLTNWNHYLAAAPGVDDVPAWWETATDSVLSHADSQKYAWIKSPGETPVDKNGRWHIIKDPQKPGVDSYDVSTYSITETAKFRSARAAGNMVGNSLNNIGKPNEDFNMTLQGYNWKCDNAEVLYSGRAWFATMTWTRSGNEEGWDTDLYS